LNFSIQYVRFNHGRTNRSMTTCTMMLTRANAAQTHIAGTPSFEDVQAWVAHESVYLALMGQFTKLIGYIAPSLWNFIKCTNGDFFGWEADATKIIKLFTPCTGPFGPEPNEEWQRQDPTWCITDEKNVMGMVTRSQGRLLWSPENALIAGRDNGVVGQVAARRKGGGNGFSGVLARWSNKVCGC